MVVAEESERGLRSRPAGPHDQRVTMRRGVFVEQVTIREPAGRELLRLLLGDQLAEQTVIAQLAQPVLSQEA